MSKINTAAKMLLHNRNAFKAQLVENFGWLFGDEKYLRLMFRYRMGYELDLDNPKSFSEKLQWLKLYDRKPQYTSLVDKHEVKAFVADRVGDQYVIPELGMWDTPAQIEWNKLPGSFVLKTTHGGGNTGVIVCKDKASFDKDKALKCLNESMKQDLYRDSREWPYKNVKRRVIAEAFLEDSKTNELRDYKFFCFDGVVKALFVATDRQKREEPYFNFFDEDYNELDLKQGHPNNPIPPEKPSCFDEMKEVAAQLSKGIPHVRVDLYEANGKVYFGEMTFYHFGGMVPFEPEKWDMEFGDMINLPTKS